jgi:hypothetical protein
MQTTYKTQFNTACVKSLVGYQGLGRPFDAFAVSELDLDTYRPTPAI